MLACGAQQVGDRHGVFVFVGCPRSGTPQRRAPVTPQARQVRSPSRGDQYRVDPIEILDHDCERCGVGPLHRTYRARRSDRTHRPRHRRVLGRTALRTGWRRPRPPAPRGAAMRRRGGRELARTRRDLPVPASPVTTAHWPSPSTTRSAIRCKTFPRLPRSRAPRAPGTRPTPQPSGVGAKRQGGVTGAHDLGPGWRLPVAMQADVESAVVLVHEHEQCLAGVARVRRAVHDRETVRG